MMASLMLLGCDRVVIQEVATGGDSIEVKDLPQRIVTEQDGAEMVLIPDLYLKHPDSVGNLGDIIPGEVYKAATWYKIRKDNDGKIPRAY